MSILTGSSIRSISYATATIVFALVFGFAAGALMARIAPQDKFSWAGLVVAPLWFSLEVLFESVIVALGTHTKAVRVVSSVAVVVGFYVAWFTLRVVAP